MQMEWTNPMPGYLYKAIQPRRHLSYKKHIQCRNLFLKVELEKQTCLPDCAHEAENFMKTEVQSTSSPYLGYPYMD